MDYIIRELKEEDKKDVLGLLGDFDESVRKNLSNEINEPIKFPYNKITQKYVVDCAGRPIAYFSLWIMGGVFWSNVIVVHPDFRNKGIAKSIFEFEKRLCKKRNLPQISKYITRKELESFNQKEGFIFSGEVDGPFEPLNRKRYLFKWGNPDYDSTKLFKQDYY